MPLTKLKEIPSIQIQNMEESVLKELCRLLRPMKYTRNNAIIEKSDPIQMLLIVERIGHGGCVKGACRRNLWRRTSGLAILDLFP
ncbi:hypothetical protein EV1_001125 [Malus domestica]